MSERDYSKQVAKRQRIKSTSLVVGVDVGKVYNAVGFMNKEGKVLGSCAKVYNSREMGSRSLWAIVERCPFPEDVLLIKVSTLEGWIVQSSRNRAGSLKKAKALYQAATRSI